MRTPIIVAHFTKSAEKNAKFSACGAARARKRPPAGQQAHCARIGVLHPAAGTSSEEECEAQPGRHFSSRNAARWWHMPSLGI